MRDHRFLALGLVALSPLGACSSSSAAPGGPSDAGAASDVGAPSEAGAPTLGACPAFTLPSLSAIADGGAPFPVASTVAPSDTSTSTVLDTDGGPQITCATSGRTLLNDVVYASPPVATGGTIDLKLDVIVPPGASASSPKPLVVFVTGGGFQFAIKEAELDQRSHVADAGFVVASIEYRTLMNDARYTDAIADVKSAIRFLRANASSYGINTSAVAVWGQSAGGYLAAMVGTTNGLSQFDVGDHLDQSSAVQAVVDQFGPSDLTHVADDFDDNTKAYFNSPGNFVATFVLGPGTTLADDPDAAAKANPITYVDPSDPPFVLYHGSHDQLVSPSETLRMHTALRAANVPSTRYVLEGANHGDLAASILNDPSIGVPWTTTTAVDTIVSFLRDKLGA